MLLWSKRSEQTASPEQTTGRTKSNPTEKSKSSNHLRWEFSSCSPNSKLERPRFHFGAACDRPETTQIQKLPPIPEFVWQQPPETTTNHCNLNKTNIESKSYYTQETSKITVASQMSPPKGTQSQNYVVAMEHPPGNQTANEPVPFYNCSNNRPTDIKIQTNT